MIEPITRDTMADTFQAMRDGLNLRKHLPLRFLAEGYCRRHGVPLKALVGSGRHRSISRHRQDLMAEMKAWGATNEAIGQFFGRDASTVSTSVQAAKARAA